MFKHFLLALLVSAGLAACASSSNHTSGAVSCGKLSSHQYCIQRGDTLTRIAQRFQVSVADLRHWNRLGDDLIHVGDVLTIKSPSNNTKTSSNTFTLKMPLQGKMVHSYTTANKGIDIAAERGAFVRAAADGTVIHAGNSIPQYGKMILIRHNATTITAYANNQNILVPMNAHVKAGQIIAEVGNSGRSDGRTALHFELRVNGKPVNPMNYMR